MWGVDMVATVESAWLGSASIRKGGWEWSAARRRGPAALHVRRFCGPPLRLRLWLMWCGLAFSQVLIVLTIEPCQY